MGYVDIHSHVLYGIDDGAKTLEESLAMLDLAARSGTSDVVATPHANARYVFDPALTERRIAELNAKATIRIHFGCDFHLEFSNIDDALTHPEKYTINHKNYLLIEFPDLSLFANTDEIFGRLLDADMIPIISHPERNALLRQRVEDIARWVALGCYVQVTASSYTGHFGRAARASAEDLLKRGLTHFIASDAHDCELRPPTLRDAYSSLADRWGEETIRPLFVDNPKAVLMGQVFDFAFPAAAAVNPRRRRWYRFFG